MMFRQRKHSAMSPYEDRKRFQNSSPKLQFWRRVFKTQLQNCSFGDEFCKTRRNFFLMAFLKTRHQNCSFGDEFWKLNSMKLQFWWRVFKTQLQNCSFDDEFSKLNSKTAVLVTSFSKLVCIFSGGLHVTPLHNRCCEDMFWGSARVGTGLRHIKYRFPHRWFWTYCRGPKKHSERVSVPKRIAQRVRGDSLGTETTLGDTTQRCSRKTIFLNLTMVDIHWREPRKMFEWHENSRC